MELNTIQIQQAATQKLSNLGRTSFSSDGFTPEETNAIAEAIVAAIAAYDKQRK